MNQLRTAIDVLKVELVTEEKHQKLVPTIGERIVHTGGSGDTQGIVTSEYGPVSGLCCGENSNPMAVSLLAAQYTRIHVANWPNHFIPDYLTMGENALLASRNMAYMCKCFVQHMRHEQS